MTAAWSSGARGFSAANVSSLATASFTVSGANTYLRVLVYSGASTPDNVTSVVWDAAGVNEALSQDESYVTFNTNFRASVWELVAPTAGTSKTVTVTWASAQNETMIIADAYTGIDQTTPTRTLPTPAQGTGNTPSLSVTSVADDLVIGSLANSKNPGDLTTIASSLVTIRQEVEGADIGGYEACAQGDVVATGTSTSVGFTQSTTSGSGTYVLFGAALIPAAGTVTTTIVTGSATMGEGIAETYTYTLDASPGGTVTVTPTAPVAGSWSPTTVGLTSGNWNTGLTSNFTASATGSGNVSSTNDGGLANDTLAVTVYPVSRPSAVTPGTWTDEAGGTLVVADINDASDATGALDAAGAEYTALPFTLDTVMATGSQTVYFRGKEFYSGKQVRLVLFANDGTTVVATGAWHTMTTTLTTYSEVLTLTAAAYKGELQKQVDPPPVTGLIFANNNATDSDVRIKWTGSNLFTYNGNTAIWEVEHTVQLGYYAVAWLVSHDDSTWHGSTNNRQRGTHPWPGDGTYNAAGEGLNGSGPTGVDQWFEIAGLTGPVDYISNPSSLTQGSLQLAYNTRYKQAVKSEIVTVSTSNDTLRHTFWPNLADTTFYIQQDQLVSSLDATSTPAFYFGASAWTASGTTNPEALGGMIRNMCLFDAALSIADIVSEANHVQNEAVTTAGIASVWYINRNPTPTDISDKQTQRATHSPSWATASRPTLYTG